MSNIINEATILDTLFYICEFIFFCPLTFNLSYLCMKFIYGSYEQYLSYLLMYFKIFDYFVKYIYIINSKFNFILSGSVLWMSSIILHLMRIVLRYIRCSILHNILCTLKINVYFSAWGWNYQLGLVAWQFCSWFIYPNWISQ